MKVVGKICAAILVCLVLALVVLSITGLDPQERRPGLWLKGELVTTPVSDWLFTDQYQTVKVQTRTWYLIPHSVTTFCVAYDGRLYLTSTYSPGLVYPHGRSWNENIARDPRVRIKIADKVYDRTLSYITDPAEKEAVLQLKAQKYPQQQVAAGSTVNVFRVEGD